MNLKCSCRISDLSLGFSVFFSMFELTRKTAIAVKSVATHNLVKRDSLKAEDSNLSRIVHGSVLVSGGILASVSYELTGRPFDVVGRAVYHHHNVHPTDTGASAAVRAILTKLKDDGDINFVQAFQCLTVDPWHTRIAYTLSFVYLVEWEIVILASRIGRRLALD